MITPSHANRSTYDLHAQLADINRRLPSAIAAITHQLHHLDGYPTGSSEVTVATSRGSSTVERTVLARTSTSRHQHVALTDTLADIAYRIEQLQLHARALDDHIRTHAPPATSDADKRRLRCTGGGGGVTESWTRPDCTNYADAGGLCAACRMRRHRWQQQQGAG